MFYLKAVHSGQPSSFTKHQIIPYTAGMNDSDKIAILIDADNTQLQKLDAIMTEVSTRGRIVVKRAYGNWKKRNLNKWENELKRLGFKAEQQFDYVSGKNATDMALVIDAMDLLSSDAFDSFVIVSSDSDFTPLALRLRESGKKVYGIGEKKTPRPFITACDKFIYVEILADVQSEEKPDGKASAPAQAQQPQKKPVSAKTIRFLAQCILESSGESGQSLLSALGYGFDRIGAHNIQHSFFGANSNNR